MNCRRVVNLMSAYVDGELTGEEMLAIRRHMSECEECAEEHKLTRMTKLALANLRTAAPRKDLARSIVMQLDEVQIPRYQRYVSSVFQVMHEKLSPVAAALAVSGLALVILSAGPTEKLGPISASGPTYVIAQGVSLLPESRVMATAIADAKPLKLADETPDFGGAKLELVSLATQ